MRTMTIMDLNGPMETCDRWPIQTRQLYSRTLISIEESDMNAIYYCNNGSHHVAEDYFEADYVIKLRRMDEE